jgi:hypothetical protein
MCMPVGLNNHALGERLMGEKLIFFGDFDVFMFDMDDLGLCYVVEGDHLYDVGALAREGLVIAEGGHGD